MSLSTMYVHHSLHTIIAKILTHDKASGISPCTGLAFPLGSEIGNPLVTAVPIMKSMAVCTASLRAIGWSGFSMVIAMHKLSFRDKLRQLLAGSVSRRKISTRSYLWALLPRRLSTAFSS